MKKGFKVITVFLLMILVVGCMDVKVKMGINSDKSVDLSMTMQLDMVKYMKAIFDMSGTSQTPMTESEIKDYLKENSDEIDTSEFLSEEDKRKMEDAGYIVSANLDQENYIYKIDISKHVANIDDISTNEDVTINLEDIFEGEKDIKLFTKTQNGTYKTNIEAETESMNEEMPEISAEQMKEYITYDFEVTLPNKPVSNNADKVSNDSKTLNWNLMNKNNFSFEFAFPKKGTAKTTKTESIMNMDTDRLLAYGLIAGGVLIIIVTIIVYNKKERR